MTRNVVLLCLDTVRKDYFDEYANRLQARSDVSFEQCRAASSCSVPSHASFMTGELPHQHGIDSYNSDYSSLGREDTFLAELPEYDALGVSANAFAGSPFGFDEMFDEFTDVSWTRRFPQGMDAEEYATKTDAEGLSFYIEFLKTALAHEHTLQTIANAALAQLDISLFSRLPLPKLLDDGASAVLQEAERLVDQNGSPFFLFINLMDAHVPHHNIWGYDQSIHSVPNTWSSITELDEWRVMLDGVDSYREDVEYFRQLYAASIDYLDRKVAAFIDRIQEVTADETTFVITADHGENLGFREDGGLFEHKSSLTEGLLHVPMSIVNPPAGYASHESAYMSQLELGMLIGGLARGETPDVFGDRIAAERIGTTIYGVEMAEEERRYWGRMLRCVYEDNSKIVWDSLGDATKYEIASHQPCWQKPHRKDVSPPSWVDDFFEEDITTYKQHVDTSGRFKDGLDDFTRDRLEDLGYL